MAPSHCFRYSGTVAFWDLDPSGTRWPFKAKPVSALPTKISRSNARPSRRPAAPSFAPKRPAAPVATGEPNCKGCSTFVQPGDTLVVTGIGRPARSMKDLQDIVHELKDRGVSLRATEQPVNTDTAAGKVFLDMLGVFAEFETNLRRERQLEGIALAKTHGAYKGRKPSVDVAEVRRLRHEEKLDLPPWRARFRFRYYRTPDTNA